MTKFEQPTKKFEADENGFVRFGDVASMLLKQQAQYASRYVDGFQEEYPNLGEGLRFEGKSDDYHNLKIHQDDINEFVRRVTVYKQSTGNPFA